MKQIVFLLLLIPVLSTAQPLGTWPVSYGDVAPTHTPSGSGTRLYFNITTNDLYTWSPAPASTWIKYPKSFDQISGCAAPAYTPTARQSLFAVNSCLPKPELYQYVSGAWRLLNPETVYTAGTGIGISSGVISNTGDLSSTNELQALSVSGGSLILSISGGVIPVTDIAPVQAVAAGAGLTVSGTNTRTLTAVDQSATNELQTLSLDGNDLTLSDGGGTVTLPGGGGGSLGTGFVDGGGSGTIPDGTAASWGASTALTIWGADGYNVTEWNAGDLYTFSQFGPDGTVFGYSNSTSGQSASASYVPAGLYGVEISTTNIGQRYISENGNILYQVSGTGAIEINAGTKIFSLDSGGDKFQVTDNGDGKGMTYNDYYPNIETNDNSFTSTRNVNALKQTPVSYTNAAAPVNTIFYSTTDSKLSYKDPGGTVHGLY